MSLLKTIPIHQATPTLEERLDRIEQALRKLGILDPERLASELRDCDDRMLGFLREDLAVAVAEGGPTSSVTPDDARERVYARQCELRDWLSRNEYRGEINDLNHDWGRGIAALGYLYSQSRQSQPDCATLWMNRYIDTHRWNIGKARRLGVYYQ